MKKKSLEMKTYELLGVKIFKKIVLKLYEILLIPFTVKFTKEERNEFIHSISNNYTIGEKNYDNINKFKKKVYLNAFIHIISIIFCLPDSFRIVEGMASLSTTIIIPIGVFINIYCIMLQRYNYIRIKNIMNKMRPHYDKQKEQMKEELLKQDILLKERTSYKILDKKKKETNITFEDLINNTDTIEELKRYKNYLNYYLLYIQEKKDSQLKINTTTQDSQYTEIVKSLEKGKYLKLRIRK